MIDVDDLIEDLKVATARHVAAVDELNRLGALYTEQGRKVSDAELAMRRARENLFVEFDAQVEHRMSRP